MSKQTKPINKLCEHEFKNDKCDRPAIIGIYSWKEDEYDVNLDKPDKVVCGEHKPRLNSRQRLRNVRLNLKLKDEQND